MSGNQLAQVFEFDQCPVRVELFDGEPWWVAKDVMAALGYSESSEVHSTTSKVPEEWKGRKPFATPGGTQEMIALSEQGLYVFLARSNMPAALPFQKWIAGEVLPSIRKTGRYAVPGKELSATQMFLLQAQAMVEQEDRMRAQEASQSALSRRVDAIESHRQDAAHDLLGLHPPVDEAAPLTERAKINRMVRTYAESTRLDHSAVWGQLYREFRDRYHVDLKMQTKSGKRGKNPLDVAESLGCMGDLYKVAWELYAAKASQLVRL